MNTWNTESIEQTQLLEREIPIYSRRLAYGMYAGYTQIEDEPVQTITVSEAERNRVRFYNVAGYDD